MRFRRSECVPRYELLPYLAAVPALYEEWKRFQFDGPSLQNPETGGVLETIELIGGRHRKPGAVYRLHGIRTEWELPPDREQEFASEAERLRRSGSPAEWDDHRGRRRAASTAVTVPTTTDVELIRDDFGRIGGRYGIDDETWSAEVEVRPTDEPRIEIDGRADLTARARREGEDGCMVWLLGGKAKGTLTLRTNRLRRGGRLLDARGSANRFRGRVEVDVQPDGDSWNVDVDLRLGARGLGRIVLLIFRTKIRNAVDEGLDTVFDGMRDHGDELAEEIRSAVELMEANGGMERIVHDSLWLGDSALAVPDELRDDPFVRRIMEAVDDERDGD